MSVDAVIERVENDPFAALVAELESTLGSAGAEDLAGHYLAAEEADFHWEARLDERHIVACEGSEDDEEERDRVAIIGFLKGRWFVGTAIVDGEGRVLDIPKLRRFDSAWDAWGAFADAG